MQTITTKEKPLQLMETDDWIL